jgi:hypothetical protein
LYFVGEVQELKVAPSRLHSNLEFGSVEENEKLAALSLTVPERPEVIVVSGAVVSTVHVTLAGVGSTLPAAPPIALTLKLCCPSERLV